MLEIKLYIASLLPGSYKSGDIAEALFMQSDVKVPASTSQMSRRISTYRELYNKLVAKPFISSRWKLLDFAQNYAKMKVTNDIPNKETGETFKCAAFIDHNNEVTLAKFPGSFPKALQNAQFISANKENIGVCQFVDGRYSLFFFDNENLDKDNFFSYVAQTIYLYPLDFSVSVSKHPLELEWSYKNIVRETVIKNLQETTDIIQKRILALTEDDEITAI